MANDDNQGRGWHGDSDEHAEVGREGGEARKKQMQQRGESYEELGSKGGRAAQRSGNAYKLTDEDRARGGRNSRGGGRKARDE
jgi:hypothetical protein